MKHLFRLIALSFAVTNGFAAEAWWPQFRGPNCSGVSETAHPPIEFGPGANQVWKVAVPGGLQSPVIWGNRIFLTAFDVGKLEVHCHSRKDGKQLWKRTVPAERLEEFHPTDGQPGGVELRHGRSTSGELLRQLWVGLP